MLFKTHPIIYYLLCRIHGVVWSLSLLYCLRTCLVLVVELERVFVLMKGTGREASGFGKVDNFSALFRNLLSIMDWVSQFIFCKLLLCKF